MNRYFFVVILLSGVLQAMQGTKKATQALKNIFQGKMDESYAWQQASFALVQGADINVPIDETSKVHILHAIIMYKYRFFSDLVALRAASGIGQSLLWPWPPSLDVNCKDMSGQTPLHYAIMSNHVHAVEFLLKPAMGITKIDVNCENNDGLTPLHYAIFYNNEYMVALLLQRQDIKVNKKDKKGNTPLHYAIESAYDKIVNVLLLAHARTDIKNNDNKTPFDYGLQLVMNEDFYKKAPIAYENIFSYLLMVKLARDSKQENQLTARSANIALAMSILRVPKAMMAEHLAGNLENFKQL